MLVKVGENYLDLPPGESIDMERKAKLFQDISTADGDVSFAFNLSKTSNTVKALEAYFNFIGKPIYSGIQSEIQSDDGITLHKGILKVEKEYKTTFQCTFYSGNSNFIGLITGNVKDLDLSQYDIDLTLVNAVNSWTLSSGIVFPIIDKGKLSERLSSSLIFDERIDEDLYLNNDLQPFLFCQDIFKKIFSNAGLKITGALLNDWTFQNLIITCNPGNSKSILDSRSTLAGKTTTQAITSGSFVKVTWIDNVDPYVDGDNNNFDEANDRWVASEACVIKLSVAIDFSSPSQQKAVAIYKNGVILDVNDFYLNKGVFSYIAADVVAGDYYEVYAKAYTTNCNINIGSFFRIDVTKIKKVFAKDIQPDLQNIDFIRNIFKMFNVVPTYDAYSKTVNLELFKNIKNKTPQNLSQYIDVESVEIDYYEFINDYAKKNNFTYQQSSVSEIEEYNKTNVVSWGNGSIDLDNSYLQEETSIFDCDFTAPHQYINDAFGISLMKLNFLGDYTEQTEHNLDSVADNGGVARFFYSGTPSFSRSVGDLFYVKPTNNDRYYGTGVVSAVGTVGINSYFELEGVAFQDDALGTFTKINYSQESNDEINVALFVKQTNVTDFSTVTDRIYINSNFYTVAAYAYFIRQYQGLSVDGINQGLGFGSIQGLNSRQRTMTETYYPTTEKILNDPIKITAEFFLPKSVYTRLDFTRPIEIRTDQINGLFYLNKDIGYKDSFKACKIELIKLG